ncbi:mas-related G-protein coupled receptor member A4-like [Gambusia affinis]|uniref:mas-related G-protein coupled receptor member A4-like n=1 Tax=Gambusia affinis TaxID=33528 RepID=UPI001CDD7105|nr:mas-related G-protein coupled receptor member A4-like [Gambusia affinis]
MEELNFNDTSFTNSFNYSNMSHYIRYSDYEILRVIMNFVNWVTIAIGFPLVIIILIAVFFQVKNGQDAPVYVINLLVSNILQLCCRISELSRDANSNALYFLTYYTILVSAGFMMCVSCERYLVVAKPLWYRFRRTIKTYVVVCTVVWILPVLFPLLIFLAPDFDITVIITVLFILAFPLFIFFLVGTIKALSGAFNVPADEKRRIAAIQVVELIIYTLLYLPIIVLFVTVFHNKHFRFFVNLRRVAACIFLSPLADTTLYLLSRKSIQDKFLASLCSEISNNQETSSTDYDSRIVTITETV